MPKVQTDKSVRDNLDKIVRENPDILRPDVTVSVQRGQLCKDIADLISRLPLTEEQGKVIFDAISARFKHKNCYRCLKLKCILGGKYVYPDGDMTKPKRFMCGDCS